MDRPGRRRPGRVGVPHLPSSLAGNADKFILSTGVTGVGTVVTASAALTTADEAWNMIRDLRKALNKLYVPQANRVAVVNAEFEGGVLPVSASNPSAAHPPGTAVEGCRESEPMRDLIWE